MEINRFGVEAPRTPWNKGKIIGQKAPLKLKEIWAIRFQLQESGRSRELALFNLAIDSKLRGCDLVRLRVNDIVQGNRVSLCTKQFRLLGERSETGQVA